MTLSNISATQQQDCNVNGRDSLTVCCAVCTYFATDAYFAQSMGLTLHHKKNGTSFSRVCRHLKVTRHDAAVMMMTLMCTFHALLVLSSFCDPREHKQHRT